MDTLVIGLLSGFFLFLALALLILCLRRLLDSPLNTGIQKLCKLVWKQSERSAAHQERQAALITRCSTLLEQQLVVNRNFQEQQIAHNSAFRTLQGQQIGLSTANRTLQEQQLASITENNALLKEQIARSAKVISFQRQQLRRYHSLRMANKRAVYIKSNSLRQKELSETRQFKKAVLAISKLLATSLTSQAAPTGAVLRTSSGSSENSSDSVPGSPLDPSLDVLEALSTISSCNVQTAKLTVTSRHNEQENTENLPSDCSTVRPVLRKIQASTILVESSVKEQPFEEENTQPEEGFVRARAALCKYPHTIVKLTKDSSDVSTRTVENAAATGSNIRTEL